ncbi:MAG: tetratricopeptide repeat protein [Spirochaetes bacterium]|nr:tetratricopeptide repeat protein [Spirochaetota bacterium]
MKQLFGVLFLLSLLPSTFLLASEIFITYTSGGCEVDLNGNDIWRDASVDMTLKSGSVVRTKKGGEMELEIDGSMITVGPGRTVEILDLLNSVSEKSKFGWLKKATRYAKAFKKSDDEWSETALAGVRGEKAEEEDLEWVVDFEDDEIVRGKDLFNEGKYTEAIGIFDKITEQKGIDAENGEAAYYLGFSLFSTLRYEEAHPYLAESINHTERDFYESALMTYSFDQYFLQNYEEALEGFSSYTDTFLDGELVPYALLMLGKCYKDMGLKDEAVPYFMRVRNEFGDSDVYMDAVEEMRGL